MSEYPDEEDEFELMYGDEMDLLREHDDLFEPSIPPRKSLNFNSTSLTDKENDNPNTNVPETSQREKLFEDDFQPLPRDEPEVDSGRKRSIQELFGDIDDILFDDVTAPKKQKQGKLEEELTLIDHILELRKLNQEKGNVSRMKDYTVDSKERDKYNLSYTVPKYSFIAVTRPDEKRVYVRCHTEAFEKEENERIMKESTFSGIMGDRFKETWEKALVLLEKQSQPDDSDVMEIDDAIIEQREEQLWVEMYKPRKYLELLSDESTNRIMLKWIKLWDKIVFNRRPKIKQIKHEEKDSKKKFFRREQLITDLDEDGRPHHKIALLCGPPGLGKTTLAHMIARHAGYNVVEINASDDRSTEAFKTSLENATQMTSVIDQDRRPNCLVFDEIDGAPSASIDYLVKFVNGIATSKSKKGAKQKKPSVLKRPVICICNDAFVPALRPLKQIAFVVNFPQTSSARLAERLMEIAKRQRVQTYLGAMLALAEKSHNDVRSCLSILHFFKAQNKPVTLTDIYKSNIGQKDMQKGLFSVWEDIFKIDRPKVPSGQNLRMGEVTLGTRMDKILHTVASFGDYDRVAQGVFENYPLRNIKNSNLHNTSSAMDWFCFSDLVGKIISSLQNYSLSSYLQYAFVEWHFAFSSLNYARIIYPSQGYEAKVRKDRQNAVINEVLKGTATGVRSYCQRLSLVLDILPLLSKIIVPTLRPVSLHLYTKEERNELLKVINIMIDYNLNYVQERTPEGTYVYNLDPNIDNLVIYEPEEERRIMTYANKQMISREVELEKMRRFEVSRKDATTEKSNNVPTSKPNTTPSKTPPKNDQAHLPNHLQTLQAKKLKTKTSPNQTKDFFGRVIKLPISSSSEKTTQNVTNDIWYQYKEGYNNAVRKHIKVANLL